MGLLSNYKMCNIYCSFIKSGILKCIFDKGFIIRPGSSLVLRPVELGVSGHEHKPDVIGILKGYLFRIRQKRT